MTPRSTSRGILYATLPTEKSDEEEQPTAVETTEEPTAARSNAGPAPADD
ncbi:hypothetical protein [Halococcus saccharolyticus]|nr:hypothetical protein [Halococcus saccharolyticus]